jgi:glycosyltransferase involved in cell wall biosynthesis
MQILWVSEVDPDPNSGAGGTELLMVEQLRQQGHFVKTIWATDLPRRLQHGNLHYAFELPRTYWNAIRREISRSAYDVVSVNLGQSFLAAKRLKHAGFAGVFVVRSHGLDDHLDTVLGRWESRLETTKRSLLKTVAGNSLNWLLRRHMRKAAHWCDGYVVSNSLDAKWLVDIHHLSREKIAVIPQAPSEPFLKSGTLPMTDARLNRLLYVANFHFAKGPHAVAVAARRLLESNASLRMTWICHPKDHDRVRALFDESILGQLEILGWMPQQSLVEQFDNHGIFLYPSLFDGFGKVFLEAMARGLCVIGTRAGGMVDIIKDGDNGFLCDFDQPNQLIERAQHLLASPINAAAISSHAIHTAAQHSWTRVGKELSDFFTERLASRGLDSAKNRER